MLDTLITFLLFFIICYILYLLFMVYRKKSNKFKSKKPRVEEAFLIGRYNIDFTKFKKKEYTKFLHIISLANSFIVSFTLIIVNMVKGVFLKLILAFVCVVPLILISYMIIGKYYQKKGLIKNV